MKKNCSYLYANTFFFVFPDSTNTTLPQLLIQKLVEPNSLIQFPFYCKNCKKTWLNRPQQGPPNKRLNDPLGNRFFGYKERFEETKKMALSRIVHKFVRNKNWKNKIAFFLHRQKKVRKRKSQLLLKIAFFLAAFFLIFSSEKKISRFGHYIF